MNLTTKDIFGLIIRFAGLFVLRLSLWCFQEYTHLLYQVKYPSDFLNSEKVYFLSWGIGYLVLGFYLLTCAPQLLKIAYKDTEPKVKDTGN